MYWPFVLYVFRRITVVYCRIIRIRLSKVSASAISRNLFTTSKFQIINRNDLNLGSTSPRTVEQTSVDLAIQRTNRFGELIRTIRFSYFLLLCKPALVYVLRVLEFANETKHVAIQTIPITDVLFTRRAINLCFVVLCKWFTSTLHCSVSGNGSSPGTE